MKRAWFGLCGAAMVCSLVFGFTVRHAEAIKPFEIEFRNLYYKPESADPAEKALAAAIETVKCNVCHEGTSKKNRNLYGQELSKLLDKTADKDNVEKIREAIEKVGGMKADPDNPSAPTFSEVIRAGKLPAGE
jgi:hypothetical protein